MCGMCAGAKLYACATDVRMWYEQKTDEELDMDMECNMLSEHLGIHVDVSLWV